MTRIFVYGSLREGMYNHDIYLKERVGKSEMAFVKGHLYSLKEKRYPALLPGDDWVIGEIFTIEDDQIVKALDELEEWYGDGNIENEYDKTFMDIYDKNKQYMEQLPVYTFNMKKATHQDILDTKIEHGDYVLHYKEKISSK